MPVADRRHGLDVVAALRTVGLDDREVHLAALFHDAGKGPSIRLWHRVAWSLGELLGDWVHRLAGHLPGGREAIALLRDHDERSADLAVAAGCSPRTVAFIRGAVAIADRPALAALRAADDAN
jgi:hypothetical protein